MTERTGLRLPRTRRSLIGALATTALSAFVAPYVRAARRSAVVKSLIRRDDTIVRRSLVGDNWHMSWAADGRQYVSLCDGLGFSEEPEGLYNASLVTLRGEPQDGVFEHLSEYPHLMARLKTEQQQRYYPFGTLALDGRIYQFLSTPNHAFTGPAAKPNARFIGVKLIYSLDEGRTWCNQDGSTPVVWEPRPSRSRENMLFFEELQDAFALLSVLQMGRNDQDNRDGYVYLYSPNGSIEGTMNELVLARVPKGRILDRSAYEFFAGESRGQSALWTKELQARKVVHTFPRGWVNTTVHPWAWMPSVTYNAPLGLYLMATWGNAPAPDGMWFAKPSYLGFWCALNPWGPWTQIHEETAWMPGGDTAARAFAPQIAPGWIAADGKSFWLVWSDFQGHIPDEVWREGGRMSDQRQVGRLLLQAHRQHKPYYCFNAQRVDLVVD